MPVSDRAATVPAPHGWWAGLAWSVVSGGVFAAAWPPLDLWPLAALIPAPLAWMALRSGGTWRAVLLAFLVHFAVGLWLNRWIAGVTAFGYPWLAFYLALYPAAFVWAVRRVARHPRLGRWPAAITVPVLWVGLEVLRGQLVMNGYPWYLIAHPLVEAPILVQTADLGGVPLVCLLAALVSGWLIDVGRWRVGLVRPAPVRSGVVVAVVWAAALVYGAVALRSRPAGTFTVLAIQTNLPQSNKVQWTLEQQWSDFGDFLMLTAEAWNDSSGGGAQIDLIAWPETMVPGFGMEERTLRFLGENGYVPSDEYLLNLEEIAHAADVPLLVGSSTYVAARLEGDAWAWDARYNSAYIVPPGAELPLARYDKYFLTPFGEEIPYASAWPWLEERLFALGAGGMSFDLDRAETVEILEVETGGRTLTLGTPICFEDTVGHVCRRMVYADGRKRADALANLSNDGWFGDFEAGRRIHAQVARFRCIENRVPMVRVANTGLSVAIDASGNLIGGIGEGRYGTGRRAGWLRAELPLDDRASVYGRVGDLWGWCMLLTAVVIVVAARRNER